MKRFPRFELQTNFFEAREIVVAHFENYCLVPPPLTKLTAIGGYPKVVSYDVLGEQLQYSNAVMDE